MPLIDAEPYSSWVIGCAIEVHKTLGPGLLESIFEAALCQQLTAGGLAFVRQQKLPVIYKGYSLDCDFRMDLVIGNALIVEVKSVQTLLPLHEAQLLTSMKVSGLRAGLMLNFNVVRLTDGIRRRLL